MAMANITAASPILTDLNPDIRRSCIRAYTVLLWADLPKPFRRIGFSARAPQPTPRHPRARRSSEEVIERAPRRAVCLALFDELWCLLVALPVGFEGVCERLPAVVRCRSSDELLELCGHAAEPDHGFLQPILDVP